MAKKISRIIIHWTAGTYHPNSDDYEHYHYLITGNCLLVRGNYEPEDNLDCKDGKYAKGAEGGNTGTIHIAFCGMKGFKDNNNVGEYPLTKEQCNFGFKEIAKIVKENRLEITRQSVLTHFEFDRNRGQEGRKIDIICLPYTHLDKYEVGKYIRARIYQELKAIS